MEKLFNVTIADCHVQFLEHLDQVVRMLIKGPPHVEFLIYHRVQWV